MKNGHHVPTAVVLAREKWTSSGLTDKVAKRLCLKPVNDASELAPNLLRLPALQIPYFNDLGKISKFYRIRYLSKPIGFAGLVEKPPRYAQPTGTLNEVYLPPLFGASWKEIGVDASLEVTITEGEFKAACASQHGIACLALGGVDVWRSGSRGFAMLPQLEAIDWKGRPVNIAFDSDAATNPNVVKAQLRLAKELMRRGAWLKVITIPTTKDGGKQGLDDFLVGAGTEAVDKWNELVNDSHTYDESGELWGMNADVCIVRNPGLIIERETGLKLSVKMFKELHYADRMYKEHGIDVKGNQTIEDKPLAPAWLRWPGRAQLARITYAPGQPLVTEDGAYNEWKGWGCVSKKGDVTPWKKLLDYMFAGLPKEREWFERWCAYPLQHPGVKMFSSVLVWGPTEGTGKTLIGYTLMDIYGRKGLVENSVEIKNKDLESGDNDWANNKQFVVGDEISSHDKRSDAEYIRSILTRQEVSINIKYVPKYRVPDYINYYFTSNNPDALFMQDTDRRNFVHEAPIKPLSFEFYDMYDKWRKSDGPSALFHYLLNLDTGDFQPSAHAMQTAAKRAMILDGKSDLGMWVAQLKEDPAEVLRPLGAKAANGCALFTAGQMLHCYDSGHSSPGKVTAIGISKELKRSGFHAANNGKGGVRTSTGVHRLFALRDVDKWSKATPAQCAAHYNEFFSGVEDVKSSKAFKKGGNKK